MRHMLTQEKIGETAKL